MHGRSAIAGGWTLEEEPYTLEEREEFSVTRPPSQAPP